MTGSPSCADGPVHELTFPLALLGYAGLTASLLGSSRPIAPALARITALLVLAHVVLVWHARFDWVLARAVRNGWSGFLLFHTALFAILASTFVGPSIRPWLVRAAFVIVSLGAIGATFRYPEVSAYRYPVIALALAGSSGIALSRLRSRAEGGDTGQ